MTLFFKLPFCSKRLFVTLILFCSFTAVIHAQGHKIIDGVEDVKIRNIGPIKSGSLVKGYYTFYEYDKADKKTVIFKLDLLDENLNSIGSKEIEGSKYMSLHASAFDGSNFCFKFWDGKAKTIQLKVYNQQGVEIANNTENTKNAPFTTTSYSAQVFSGELGVVEKGGFVNYSFRDADEGFFVNYVDGNTKTSWNRAYEPSNKYKTMSPVFLGGNQEMILTAVSVLGKGADGRKGGNFILGSNTKTGDPLFDISTDFGNDFIAPFNSTISNDRILIIGLVYPSFYSFAAIPQGIAFLELDKKGTMIAKTFKSFDETIGKFQRLENHKFPDGFFPFIHEIVRTNDGNTLILAEKFKHAPGVTLGNLILFELDKNNSFKQAKEVSREAQKTPSLGMNYFNSYLAASTAKQMNYMSYQYMQNNADNSEVSFSYTEHESKPVKGVFRINYFGQLKYKNGKITTDKVEIKYGDENADETWLYPAKSGYVLKVSYYKKKKELSMDFVKLNN